MSNEMSQETRYVVRRADGKYLVIATLADKRRLALWIDNVELATTWPFMTGATLAMGLDLDPCLEAERGGWDVVPVVGPDPTAVEVAQFSIAIPALLLCLLFSSVASAQSRFNWTPVIAVAAGQSFDAISTHRFLRNGSGCVESNRLVGTHPSSWTLAGEKAAVIVGSALLVKVSGKSVSKPIRIIGQTFAYALGATGARSGFRNVSLCGW